MESVQGVTIIITITSISRTYSQLTDLDQRHGNSAVVNVWGAGQQGVFKLGQDGPTAFDSFSVSHSGHMVSP